MVEYKGYITAQQPELTETQLAAAPPLLGQPVRHAFCSFHNSTNCAPHPFLPAKLGKTPTKERTCTDKKEKKIYKEIQRDRVQSHI